MSWFYLLWCSASHYFIHFDCLLQKHSPISVSPLNARVFDGNPFMDLMDFSGLFLQDLGDEKKKQKAKNWPARAPLPRVPRTAEDSDFCLHQKNENFWAYKTGRMSQYGSESWLTTIPCEKKTGHNIAELLLTSSEVKLGDRLESRKRDKNNNLNFGDSYLWSLHFRLTRKTESILPPKKWM